MNKKILILNGVWLVIAIVAFALGRYDGSSSSTDSGAGKTSANSYVSKYAAGDGPDRATAGKEAASESASSSDASAFEAVTTTGAPSAKDMRQLVLDALNETNPLKSNLLFAQLLDQLTVENAEAAMETLRENADGQTMYRQMGLLTYAYGALDGEAAIAYAQGLEGRGAVFTTSSALSGWASENPQAAMDWLNGQEDLQGMEAAMFARGLVNGLAQTNLNLATEYAISIEDPTMQRQFFDVIAREQMNEGIEAASAWVTTLPAEARTSALENIARQAAREDLDAAAEWVVSYANEEYGARAVAEIADELAERDPNRALQFVYDLPAGDAQNQGIAATVREMDFEVANQLIIDMEEGSMRDYATASFIGQARREDPQGALAMASLIGDDALRERAQISALEPLYRVTPDAALEQAAEIGLSQAAQEQLIESAERRPDFGRGGFDGGPFGPGRGRGPGGRGGR